MSTFYDPSLGREQRRARARDAVAASTPERREELRQRFASVRSSRNGRSRTALPTMSIHALPVLTGNHDLVYPVISVSDHMEGPGNEWLSLKVFPHHLRPKGFVYLKLGGQVAARARVRGIGYRENVVEHTPNDDGVFAPLVSTATLELEPGTWEAVDFPAAKSHQQGFRYLDTDNAAATVSHLVGGKVLATHAVR